MVMRTRTGLSMIAAVGCLLGSLTFAAPATARSRWPVIGCWDFSYNFFTHYAWKYKPSGLCSLTETTEGIDHARWSHWGHRQASARGDFVDDVGFMYPARITAYRL